MVCDDLLLPLRSRLCATTLPARARPSMARGSSSSSASHPRRVALQQPHGLVVVRQRPRGVLQRHVTVAAHSIQTGPFVGGLPLPPLQGLTQQPFALGQIAVDTVKFGKGGAQQRNVVFGGWWRCSSSCGDPLRNALLQKAAGLLLLLRNAACRTNIVKETRGTTSLLLRLLAADSTGGGAVTTQASATPTPKPRRTTATRKEGTIIIIVSSRLVRAKYQVWLRRS